MKNINKLLAKLAIFVSCFGMISSVYAATPEEVEPMELKDNIEINGILEYNQKYYGEAFLGVDFYTTVHAVHLSINYPKINIKVQSKVFLIYNEGLDTDVVVKNTNSTYQVLWNAKKSYDTKVTWKNTTSGTSIAGNYKAYNC